MCLISKKNFLYEILDIKISKKIYSRTKICNLKKRIKLKNFFKSFLLFFLNTRKNLNYVCNLIFKSFFTICIRVRLTQGC